MPAHLSEFFFEKGFIIRGPQLPFREFIAEMLEGRKICDPDLRKNSSGSKPLPRGAASRPRRIVVSSESF
jgi:hypothetical protein